MDKAAIMHSLAATFPSATANLLAEQGMRLISSVDGNEFTAPGARLEVKWGGKNNRVLTSDALVPGKSEIDFSSSSDSLVVLEAGAPVNTKVRVVGRAHTVLVHSLSAQGLNTLSLNILGEGNSLRIGRACSFVSAQFILHGNRKSLIVGEDCMFSWGITIRNFDSHSIFDHRTMQVLNPPGNIEIGRHVWFGQDSIMLRGAEIGAGSIIGARAVVTANIPERCVAAGSPARVVRSGVSWSRRVDVTRQDIAEILRFIEYEPEGE